MEIGLDDLQTSHLNKIIPIRNQPTKGNADNTLGNLQNRKAKHARTDSVFPWPHYLESKKKKEKKPSPLEALVLCSSTFGSKKV